MATELENLVIRISADTQAMRAELSKAMGQTRASADRMTSAFDGVRSAVVRLAGAAGIGMIGRSVTQAAMAMQRFEGGLRAATGSAQSAQAAIKFVRDESKRLGLNFEEAAGAFTKLSAAARGTALQGAETRKIFTSVAEASRVLGLSADQTSGALTAIEQMISKGKVSAEELRGQLGERLPGAFQIAARAMGVTTQKLDEMLQKGEIFAEDFLPKFADEMRKTFASELPNAVQRADAEFNRFSNSMFELRTAVGNEILPTLSKFASFLATDYIPAVAWAAREVGLLSRNLQSMSEGELRLREADLVEKISLADRSGIKFKADSPAHRAAAENRARYEEELFQIRELLKAYDQRNERIVKFGAASADAEDKATTGAQQTTEAVKKAASEFEKERDKLLERLSTVNDNTESARILFETTMGGLKDITAAEKAELKVLAERLDIEQDTADVREYMREQALNRERDWEQERQRLAETAQREETRKAKELLAEQKRLADQQAEILAEPYKNAIRGMQDLFTDTFESLFRGQIDSWKDFAGSIKSIFIRLAAEIASLLVFRPVMNAILGFGGANGALASAGGVGSGLSPGSLLGAFGGGGSGFSLAGLMSGFQSEFGAGLGIGIADKLGLGAFGQSAFASAGLNAPYGIFGSLGAQLLGLGGGLGGSIGGAAGGLLGGGLGGSLFASLGSAAGPVGAIAGSFLGSVLGGLFGSKPSRKTSHGRVLQQNGRFSVQSRGGPGGTAVDATTGKLASELNALVSAGNKLNFAGGINVIQETNAGKTGEHPFFLSAVPDSLRKGAFAGLNPKNPLAFDSSEALIAAVLQQVKQFGIKQTAAEKEETAAMKANAKELLASADATQHYRLQVQGVINQFADLRANASRLGLSLAAINQAESTQLSGMLSGMLEQRRQALGIPGLEAFQQELSFGSLSPFSATEKFSRGKAELDALTAQAMGGDPEALRSFPQLAQQVLGLGRDAFASGPEFASLFTSVNSTLQQVLTRQREIEDSLLGGLEFAVRESGRDNVIALEKGVKLLATELRSIQAALRRAS